MLKALQKIGRVLRYPLKAWNFKKTVLTLGNVEDRFTEIYKKNHWGSEESVSGFGSTLKYTEKLRAKLPELFEKFSIKTVFDAPCGDFNWMRQVLKDNRLNYIGGDIVAPLIDAHNQNYQDGSTRFIHVNLIDGVLPQADLMICRDCLFHLSFSDTKSVLENFVRSNIPYLLTTTYTNTDNFKNKDILTGDFRRIDLFSAPYCFPKDVCFRIDDWLAPQPKREMCLWSRPQILNALGQFEDH